MNSIRKILCFIVFFSYLSIRAQEFDLGKVTVKELQEKQHPTDSSAAAAILYNKGKTFFKYTDSDGFTIVTEVETRIKIYKKDGYDWATKAVAFYVGGRTAEQVSFSKAVTYNLVDGKIEKTKLKSDGEFRENANKFWALAKITMPNVKEGSVIEYKYTIESPYISTFPEWKFQEKIPVNYCEYATEVPEYYTYNAFFKGFLTPTITKSSRSSSFVMSSKKRTGVITTTTKFSYDKIEYLSNTVNYVLKDIPALKDEAYVNNIDNYSSSLMHELASEKYPNSLPKQYATDWESIVKTIYESDDFGGELNKKNYFEEDLNTLLAGETNRNQRLVSVFEFVKQRMNWNKYNSYYCSDGVKTAYKQKTGNIAEINLILTSMLQSAGFKARPVLVSTRANGVALFPNKSAYNYVIVAVEEEDNKITLLDASDKYSLPNQIPFRALNWFGRLIREDGSSKTIDLMSTTVSRENISLNYDVDKEGKISGKIRKIYSDYNAQIFRSSYVGFNEEQYLEKLENRSSQIEISDYSRSNEREIYQPVQEDYAFKGNNFCDIVGAKIFISPMLFLATTKNPFDQEKREYPVDFGFPFQDRYNITLKIPEGYAIESLPTAIYLKTEETITSFKYIIQSNGNQIQIAITQDVSVPIVSPLDYSALQDFYKKIIAKQNEKIVLKKI